MLTAATLPIPGPSGDSGLLSSRLAAFSQRFPFLKFSLWTFGRVPAVSARRGSDLPSLSQPVRSSSLCALARSTTSRQLSAAPVDSPAGCSTAVSSVTRQTDEPRRASENRRRQRGRGEGGPVLKACRSSARAKVGSPGAGKHSRGYFCPRATSTSPCYRSGGNRRRPALLIKNSSAVFINDQRGAEEPELFRRLPAKCSAVPSE